MAVIAPQTEQSQTGSGQSCSEQSGSEQTGSESLGLFALLDAVDAALDATDPACLSMEDAAGVAARVTRHERKVVAYKTTVASRLAQGSHFARTGHRSAAEFLSATTGDSLGEAKDLIRLGEALTGQPGLAESFRAGRLSRRRAARVSDAVKVNPGKEAELVGSAESDSEATLNERCQRAKAEGRSTEAEARHFQKLHRDRRCRTWTDDDGAFRLFAVLAPEAGAGVLAALEAQADRQFRQARGEGRFETPDAYRADATVALLTGRGILGQHGDGDGTAPNRPTCDPRATVSVVVDVEALRRGSVGDGERCEIPGWARWPSTTPGSCWARPWWRCSWPRAPTSPPSTRPDATCPDGSGRPSSSGTRGAWCPTVTPAWDWRTTTGSPTSPTAASPPSTIWPGSVTGTTWTAPTAGSS